MTKREESGFSSGIEEKKFNISEELKKLPKAPGVYLMHGPVDEIIYVGKNSANGCTNSKIRIYRSGFGVGGLGIGIQFN